MFPTPALERLPEVYDAGSGIRAVTVFTEPFCSGLAGAGRLDAFPLQMEEVGLPLAVEDTTGVLLVKTDQGSKVGKESGFSGLGCAAR
ncbi:hypothetical protein Holit_01862 [Hollandina sp. SP2]